MAPARPDDEAPPPMPEPQMRLRVLAAVIDYPGLHVRGIARLLGVSASHVEYHAESLLDAELVTDAEHEGYRRFYPRPGAAGPSLEDAAWLATLREPVPLHIALLVAPRDIPTTHKELTAALGLAKSTVSFHLAKLIERGILQKAAQGGLIATDTVRLKRLLVRHRPVPDLFDQHFVLWLALYNERPLPPPAPGR